MRRRDFVAAAAATVWPGALGAQGRRVPVVGVLTNTSTADVRVLIVPEALRARGYTLKAKTFGTSSALQKDELSDCLTSRRNL